MRESATSWLGPVFLFLVGGALAGYERLTEPWQELVDSYQQREIAKVRYNQIVATGETPMPPPGFPP
jgi:hypothetical protein